MFDYCGGDDKSDLTIIPKQCRGMRNMFLAVSTSSMHCLAAFLQMIMEGYVKFGSGGSLKASAR